MTSQNREIPDLQSEFIGKYDLEDNFDISKDKLLKRDERFDDMHGDISFDEVRENISHIQLIPPVPEEVKDIFLNAKKIFLFGYFEWDLFTHSWHYSLLAVEAALRQKHKDIYGKPDGHVNLKAVYDQLIAKDVIDSELEWLYESAKNLRNSLSHPDFQTIIGPNPLNLQRSAEAINHIWDE